MEPTGYCVKHSTRDQSILFGPFLTMADVKQWLETTGKVHGVYGAVIEMTLTPPWGELRPECQPGRNMA